MQTRLQAVDLSVTSHIFPIVDSVILVFHSPGGGSSGSNANANSFSLNIGGGGIGIPGLGFLGGHGGGGAQSQAQVKALKLIQVHSRIQGFSFLLALIYQVQKIIKYKNIEY